jgi:hypothetical protein
VQARWTPSGYLDLLGPAEEPPSTGLIQDLMLSGAVSRI